MALVIFVPSLTSSVLGLEVRRGGGGFSGIGYDEKVSYTRC